MSSEVTAVLKIIKSLFIISKKGINQMKSNEAAMYAETDKQIKRKRDIDDRNNVKRPRIDNPNEKYIMYSDSTYDKDSESYVADLDEIRIMKVVDLKKKCKEYNLPTNGRKMELIERLEIYLTNLKDNKKVEMEIEPPSSNDETTINYENPTNNDTQDEENSVIIYPQEQEAEQGQENKQEKETGNENENKNENEEEAEQETVKYQDNNQEEGSGDGDGDNSERSNIDELPVENNKKENKPEEKIVEFKLFNMTNCHEERLENVKDEEVHIEKHQKPCVSLTKLNDLLNKITEKAVKPPPRPSIDSDIEKDLPIKKTLKKEVVDESLIVKKINIKPTSTNEDQKPKQSMLSLVESPIGSPAIEEEEESNKLKRKIEMIQSKLQLQQKKNIKKSISSKCIKLDTTSQNDKFDESSSSSFDLSTASDEPALKKMKTSVKENIKSKDIETSNQKETKPTQPSNLCGNISTFIKRPESNNNKPSNLSKNISTFIKSQPVSEGSKRKSLFDHKFIGKKNNYKMFSREKPSTTAEPKKEKVIYPSSYKLNINNNNLNNKYTSYILPVKQEPPKTIIPTAKSAATASSSTTNYSVKKEVSKYVSFVKKEAKDIPQQVKKEPIKEKITEVINVDESQELPKNNDSANNSSSSNNSNKSNNSNSQLSWADPENLMRSLREQSSTFDLESLFGEVTTCDIDEIFPTRHPKPRGSSGNWLNDAVTKEEEERYKKNIKYGKEN